MRWHPAVRKQFQSLLKALGQKFDGKIAGINLQETSIGVEETSLNNAGFTYVGYRNAILDNMKALKAALPNSIAMQYANFMPGEWLPSDDKGFLESVYKYGQENNIARRCSGLDASTPQSTKSCLSLYGPVQGLNGPRCGRPGRQLYGDNGKRGFRRFRRKYRP
jgi:hypothetical protein